MKYLLLICFVFSSLIGYSQFHDLKIEIRNIIELKGNIIVAIYNKSDDFPKKGKHYQDSMVQVNNYSETIIFRNLPVGDYAVAIFHDRNNDDKLNKNIFGLPKEGFGFSNNCKPFFSAPSFKCTKFNLSSDKSIIIELIY